MIHSKFKNLNSKFSLPRYDHFTAKPGFFLAQVVGESMSRRIPNGSWCLCREPSDGSRNGKVVIVQSRDIQNPDTGGQYTVQIYRSEKTETEDSWSHRSIRLEPDSMEWPILEEVNTTPS
jgi:phage repressor protein C with HTH and peptisase S24 domain